MVFKWRKLLQATWLRKRGTILARGIAFSCQLKHLLWPLWISKKINKKKNNYELSFVYSPKLGQNSFRQTLLAGGLLEQPL